MRYEYFARNAAEEYVKQGIADGSTFPDMDLYIDQMVACLNKELSLYGDKDEGPVSKGMVSNYTKHKMIPGPEGKKYTKDHLYFMLLVFYLKNSLSMDQIQRLMAPVIANYESEWDDHLELGKSIQMYMQKLREKEAGLPEEIDRMIAEIKSAMESVGEEDDTLELISMIFSLIMRSNAERYVAEQLLAEYFGKKK